MKKKTLMATFVTSTLVLLAATSSLAQVQITTFTAGTPIKASEVNSNFEALAAAVEASPTMFVHLATAANCDCDPVAPPCPTCAGCDYVTYLDHDLLNGNPQAEVVAFVNRHLSVGPSMENMVGGGLEGFADYDAERGQWYVFMGYLSYLDPNNVEPMDAIALNVLVSN